MMSNKIYDVCKWIAQIVLPAVAVFWYTIAIAWKLPHIAEVETTIVALDTLLGACLGISTYQYNKKENSIDENQNSSSKEIGG